MLFGSFLISKQSAPSIERLDEQGAAAPRLAAMPVLPTCLLPSTGVYVRLSLFCHQIYLILDTRIAL